MNEQDAKTVENMIKFGGNFVKRLGEALQYADPGNLDIIKIAFPGYWNYYSFFPVSTPLTTTADGPHTLTFETTTLPNYTFT